MYLGVKHYFIKHIHGLLWKCVAPRSCSIWNMNSTCRRLQEVTLSSICTWSDTETIKKLTFKWRASYPPQTQQFLLVTSQHTKPTTTDNFLYKVWQSMRLFTQNYGSVGNAFQYHSSCSSSSLWHKRSCQLKGKIPHVLHLNKLSCTD